MGARLTISTVIVTLALAGFSLASAQSNDQRQPPSDVEALERTGKLIANQHKDDIALEEYERIERHVDRSGGSNPRILEDKTYRVVPTGPGTLKILLKDGDKPTDPADYRNQLRTWRELLELASNPNNPKIKAEYARTEKKKRERAELVNAAGEAFALKWLGRETLNGRDCYVIQLDSNPSFHPHSTLQEALTHATAKMWVDHDAIQIVRAEAYIIRDVSFGSGILGKLYHGGVFFFEQAELAPGVWLPTRFQYDFTGRKFLFGFGEHQFIDASRYRYVGPPKAALEIAQKELEFVDTKPEDP